MSRKKEGVVLWFTGLSGAGKSTLAEAVAPRLRAQGKKVEILDGDVVRTHLSKDLGFSREDRDTNIARIAFVAHLLQRNGVVVLVAAISPFRRGRSRTERSASSRSSGSSGTCSRRTRRWPPAPDPSRRGVT